MTYFSLTFTVILCFFKGFDAFLPKFDYKLFITSYIGIPIYIIGYCGYKLIRRTSYVRIDQMDLTSGSREFQDIEEEEEEEDSKEYYRSLNWKQKVWYQLKNW